MQDFYEIVHSLQQSDSKVSTEIQSKKVVLGCWIFLLHEFLYWGEHRMHNSGDN